MADGWFCQYVEISVVTVLLVDCNMSAECTRNQDDRTRLQVTHGDAIKRMTSQKVFRSPQSSPVVSSFYDARWIAAEVFGRGLALPRRPLAWLQLGAGGKFVIWYRSSRIQNIELGTRGKRCYLRYFNWCLRANESSREICVKLQFVKV